MHGCTQQSRPSRCGGRKWCFHSQRPRLIFGFAAPVVIRPEHAQGQGRYMESSKKAKTINLAELRCAIDVLFDDIMITHGLTEVAIEDPLYWCVLADQARDMDQVPVDFGVGDLNDDLEFALGPLNPDSEPVALTLTEVAPLLAYIGEVAYDRGRRRGS